MKLKKGIPLIDQHNQQGFWGGKFGGSFIPETLKKPIEELTTEFQKLRKNKKRPKSGRPLSFSGSDYTIRRIFLRPISW